MAAPVIENWIKLVPGVPKRLHFVNHVVEVRRIMDPVLKAAKDVQGLIFAVDREDGRPVSKTFSVLSERLAGELAGWLEGRRYLAYEFTFIKDAPGFVPPRLLAVEPYRG